MLKWFKNTLNILFLLLFLFVFSGLASGESAKKTPVVQPDQAMAQQQTGTKALRSILELEDSIKKRIKTREKQLAREKAENEKQRIEDEIKALQKNLAEATADFERLATGVDPASFSEKRKDTFSWQEELVSLLRPAIRELKNLTINAREKTALQADIVHYEEMQPIAQSALSNLQKRIKEADDPELRKNLEKLLPDWKNINEQLNSKLEVLQLKLKNIEERDRPFIDTLGDSISHFFKNRGLYLGLALGVFVLTLLCFSLVRKLVQKHVPAFRSDNRSLVVRVSEILFRLLGFLIASLTLFVVFYMVEDWTLLSLLVIFFIAVLWTFRVMVPQFWKQGELLLNVGSVREGERLMLHGVPWLVKKINMYTDLENPDLNSKLRLPIGKLIGQVSREFYPGEPWFPCRKNDWVILSDGSFGKVISLSHEIVVLLERGGSRKTYRTSDFLGLVPRNLSTNFRIKEIFGLDYAHQQLVTRNIPEILHNYIKEQFEQDGFAEQLLDLQVSFNQAGASSLDLIIIADFKGNAAPLYNRIRRTLQRYCVDACSANGWNIPFPQLTVHGVGARS